MRDYVTTVFNLIVGLVDADKIVYLALIGLGVILIWQLLSLLTNFHRKFAIKCRKISKFLTHKGLSADNYNNFLALIAKMPQEFIRGYKTFENASYGLPSDYIRRFDSIDVEVNGGVLNHGKSLVKAAIYGWTIILFVLSLALLGNDAALTGFALADALIVPVLFLILAKVIYFIFNAIKQQQYRVAVDEFNEMLDIMNDKIENNDNLPGPDVLAELMDTVPTVPVTEEPVLVQEDNNLEEPIVEPVIINEVTDQDFEALNSNVEENVKSEAEQPTETEPVLQTESVVESTAEDKYFEDVVDNVEEQQVQSQVSVNTAEEVSTDNVEPMDDVYTEEELVNEINEPDFEQKEVLNTDDFSEFESLEKLEENIDENVVIENNIQSEPTEEVIEPVEEPKYVNEAVQPVVEEQHLQEEVIQEVPDSVDVENVAPINGTTENNTQIQKEEEMEEKRGRGRPKKVAEGELVIKNDKQFEEVLQRAEKLMRKSEEALSGSQAKRVEKSLKELIDAMTKYKEEH